MTLTHYLLTLGDKLDDLARDQADWSERTFGPDTLRGPIGGLKHLEKEAREAQACPKDIKEYADILILWLDASRRAGFTPLDVIEAAIAKMQENKARSWPAIDLAKLDEPTEHVRESDSWESCPHGVRVSCPDKYAHSDYCPCGYPMRAHLSSGKIVPGYMRRSFEGGGA
jgi:hypothetical protein